MKVSVHRPTVSHINSHDETTLEAFHTVYLSDGEGEVVLFIDAAWEAWDSAVAAVDGYRRGLIQR